VVSGFCLVAAAAALSSCGGTSSTSQVSVASTTAAAPTPSVAPVVTTATAASATTGTSAIAASAAATTNATGAAPKANVSQTVLNWFLPLSSAPEIAIWTEFVTRFQQAHPEIKINSDFAAWGAYWTKLEVVMAGGAIPDVIWLHYTYLADWASKNVMLPLDTYLSTDKLDPTQYVFNDAMIYKGKMYAIPKDNGVNAMWFNKAMFRAANVTEPGFQYSWTDWLAAMQNLTVVQGGQTKQWGTVQPTLNTPRGEGFYSWFASMGGKLYSADMMTSLIDQPESVAALQFMADIVNKQHVAPPPGAIKQPGDSWLNQLVATTWAHHGEEFSYQDQKKSFPYDEVYYPQGSKLVISGGTTGFAIPKASKQKADAWTLTKFMTGEEQQKLIVAQHRWASGLRSAVPLQYAPGYNTPNYVACHVDPLTGKGPQAVAAPSPAALTQIEQLWGTLLDPVRLGKQQARDVAPALKQQMDRLLQQPTQI
jgi:multiple sugar transport system substrate-binding protein